MCGRAGQDGRGVSYFTLFIEVVFCLLYSQVGVSGTTNVRKTTLRKTSGSEHGPTSFATLTMINPGLPVTVSFYSGFKGFFVDS